MQIKLAKIISILLHPLLIPTYLFLILFSLNSYVAFLIPHSAKLLILAMVFITTFLFPLLFILMMVRKGLADSLQMEKKEERIYPFITTTVFYILSIYIIRQIQISEVFHFFIIGSATIIITALLINFYWKVSVHMMGMGGLLGALIAISIQIETDLFGLIIITIILSGFVGYSRLMLKAHNPAQVYTGFLTGVLIMLSVYMIQH